MGEQAGIPLEGTLGYVPQLEFVRILAIEDDKALRSALLAGAARINALYMIARAGSGHIGSSFSSLDILSWLHLEEMKDGDIFFSSKGHDAPGYYALMMGLGRLDFDLLHRLRRLGGLPGHPDVSVSVCTTNTGSLGMGISKAKGILFANRQLGRKDRVFVMTGDGELQEGQIWESLVSAANQGLGNVIAIVDHNKLQSDTFMKNTSDLGDLEAKFAAFGWHVARCDGHDAAALRNVFAEFDGITDRPKVLIADTIKGRGVSFMEHTSLDSDVAMYRFHSGAPDMNTYIRALTELKMGVDAALTSVGVGPLILETVDAPARPVPSPKAERLVEAYSRALIEQARANPRIIALDADLILDTGLIPFKEQFPERFVECGIAEQDMVSQAGGMALGGLLPVVHSFACFLSARPNEQIYNNATEHTRIVYVGSLAGVVPGGPGHSHQAVRDISVLAAIPGLELIEPCSSAETVMALDYCLDKAPGSTYLRLVSIPCYIPYSLPTDYRLTVGRGSVLREGSDVVIIGYGPVLLSQAWKAAENLAQEGISVRLINLPWLNRVDHEWLSDAVTGSMAVVTLDNHYLTGGQGEMLVGSLVNLGHPALRVVRLGVEGVPQCGTNDEVLRTHGLDSRGISDVVRELV
jgi:transketolase